MIQHLIGAVRGSRGFRAYLALATLAALMFGLAGPASATPPETADAQITAGFGDLMVTGALVAGLLIAAALFGIGVRMAIRALRKGGNAVT